MTDPRAPTSKIELRMVRAHHTATVRETIRQDDIAAAMGRIFRAVERALARQGVSPTGAPFARYHSFGETVDLEAGLPVGAPIEPDGEVKPSELPGGPAALAVHAGPYEGLGATYEALEAWLASTGHTAGGPPWEIYLTDPSTEPDPARWLTEVIYPLRKP
jgi:effector-binding domain-containing protein